MSSPWVQSLSTRPGTLLSVTAKSGIDLWSEDSPSSKIEYLPRDHLVLTLSDEPMRGDGEGIYIKVLTSFGNIGWVYRFGTKEIT